MKMFNYNVSFYRVQAAKKAIRNGNKQVALISYDQAFESKEHAIQHTVEAQSARIVIVAVRRHSGRFNPANTPTVHILTDDDIQLLSNPDAFKVKLPAPVYHIPVPDGPTEAAEEIVILGDALDIIENTPVIEPLVDIDVAAAFAPGTPIEGTLADVSDETIAEALGQETGESDAKDLLVEAKEAHPVPHVDTRPARINFSDMEDLRDATSAAREAASAAKMVAIILVVVVTALLIAGGFAAYSVVHA